MTTTNTCTPVLLELNTMAVVPYQFTGMYSTVPLYDFIQLFPSVLYHVFANINSIL